MTPARARALALLPLALATVGVVAAIYAVDYLPTNDGPQIAYTALVRARASDAPFARYYAAAPLWTTWLWGWMFAVLERVFGWREAYRAAVAVAAVAWVWGSAAVVRILPRERSALLWVAAAGALQWAFYMGFFNWLLGVGLGLAAFGLGVRDGHEPEAGAWFRCGVLLAIAAVAHPFGAQLGGCGLLVHVLLSTPRATWPRRFVWLALVGLVPLIVTVGAALELDGAALSPWFFGNKVYIAPWAERIHGLAWFYLSGPWYRWAPALGLAFLGLAAGTLRTRTSTPLDRTLLVLASMLTALALLTPRHTVTWLNFSPRFVPVAALFASFLVPLEVVARPRGRALANAFLVATFVASTAWAMRYHMRLRAGSAPWLAGLGAPESAHGTLLPIVTEARIDPSVPREALEVPFARPHVNTGLVYAMDRLEASPHTFSMLPAVHVIRDLETFPRAPAPSSFQDVLDRISDRTVRAAEIVRLASYGVGYDEVVVEGREDVVQAFLDRGYDPIHRGERLLLARFRGCPTMLRVEGHPRAPLRMDVVLGWDPAPRTVDVEEGWAPAALPAERPLRFASCGPIRVHIVLNDASVTCAGEDEGGMLHGEGGHTIVCVLVAKR